MNFKLIFCILNLSISLTTYAADLSTELNQALVGKIDRPFMGVFLVAKGDDIIYEKVHGKFSKHSVSSQFILGSITKQFTTTIILQLVDKGLINLDTPIKTYLPDLTNDWASIVTLRHLLSHTSGIVDLNSPLEFPPGTQTKYAKVFPYYLAGIIAARISGKDYDTLVAELFSKAGMSQVGLVISSDMNKNRIKYPQLPRSFEQQRDGIITEVKAIEFFETIYNPCGGIITNVRDLLQWHRSLHTGKLISNSSYKQMLSSYGLIRHHSYGHVGYGLGLQLINEDGFLEISHHGYGAGYVSSIFYYPESEISIIAFENVAHSWSGDRKRIYANHDSLRDIIREHIKFVSHSKLNNY